MTNHTRLKRLSRYSIGLFAYVIMISLVSVAVAIILASITPAITGLWGAVLNSGSIHEIALSSALLAIITLAGIWLIIGFVLLVVLIDHLSTGSKARTNPSATQ